MDAIGSAKVLLRGTGRWRTAAAALVPAVLGLASGCADKTPPGGRSAPAPNIYSIELTVRSTNDLPDCNKSLAGTTAFVESPPGLFSCIGTTWVALSCTKMHGGAIAYASATKTIYACVAGTWTPVDLPGGPPGPPGDAGPPGPPGAPGALLSIKPEPPGSHCATGGQRIDVGADDDRDGTLDADEVDSTHYVCNGAPGPQGPAGMNGASALVAATTEPAGANCSGGGVKLSFGLDTNGNGVLDGGEATSSSYVCNGPPGSQGPPGMNGKSTIVTSNTEPAGANCPAGGIKLTFGTDTNGDGGLEEVEITATSYVCNGSDGGRCGNGVVETGEECDDGNLIDVDACTSICKLAVCGDGIFRAGVEQCDDANSSNTDACLNDCRTARCGDGFVRPSVEQCDDANSSNSDGCTSQCRIATCGDGFVRAGVEVCDDGNTFNETGCPSFAACTTCSADCHTVVMHPMTCGSTTTPQNCGACGHACPGLGRPATEVQCVDPATQLCGISCVGENYDVNGDPADGCERPDALPAGHLMLTATSLPDLPCSDAASSRTLSGDLLADARTHLGLSGWDAAVGAAPDYWTVVGTGGAFCFNDYHVTLRTTGGMPGLPCYRLAVVTDKGTRVADTSGEGSVSLDGDSGSYSSGSRLFFIVTKTCSERQSITYELAFHL